MAGNDRLGDTTPSQSSDSIGRLRGVAEKHLKDIEEERLQEEKDEVKRIQELEHYSKHKKQGKQGMPNTPSEVSVPKMRSAQDVLKRLQWDTDLDMSRYIIGYLERFAGIKELAATHWISEVTEEDWIPQHRIKYFKRISENGEAEIVWDREKRIDKIFGSGLREDDETVDVNSEDGGRHISPFKVMAETAVAGVGHMSSPSKLTGRAFYESIGSPKYIMAPMVDRSEFAWRLLTRSYLDEERSKSFLAYTPMLHARLFRETARFRDEHFQPTKSSLVSKERASASLWLDGNPTLDRPLFVQFCANKPEDLLEAAQYVAPYCDAVDLNLGCPQGIARNGRYGAFLQEDWDTIYKMINKLHNELSVPVTAKMRILDTKEKTLEYAKMILSAGASILTVHGRRREQKGHNTGLADWQMIRYLREQLPPETVIFANGNILNSGDLESCLAATGADGVMSAEGNICDPTIFADPPKEYNPREYWYGPDGKGGYRVDAVFRRYLDIIHRHVLGREPPVRKPLYVPGDPEEMPPKTEAIDAELPPRKRQKRLPKQRFDPSLRPMQGHLFQLLRPLVSTHTNIRDALAQTRCGDMDSFEGVLAMVEAVVKTGLDEYTALSEVEHKPAAEGEVEQLHENDLTPTEKTRMKYRRPWWVCQPYVRPLPDDAVKMGAMQPVKGTSKEGSREVAGNEDNAGRSIDVAETPDLPVHSTTKEELAKPTLVFG
ncbi:hypothetical protein AYO21_10998 [Fonsecaea monophora]|uniref:tRNA-dihydrouridine(16/17) synthase [NAD(P)(+)] n=1 Tax=Fonsecaea monophora TaxID=254056 RepID=A0A177ET78_9EURO|nr:hypothetical protein AYO21_10998 [Fonsecaea monophora]OAG34836.1 hypothetical protein AYO21_10998 [Fonsecaea monophora]